MKIIYIQPSTTANRMLKNNCTILVCIFTKFWVSPTTPGYPVGSRIYVLPAHSANQSNNKLEMY